MNTKRCRSVYGTTKCGREQGHDGPHVGVKDDAPLVWARATKAETK